MKIVNEATDAEDFEVMCNMALLNLRWEFNVGYI
jgi:hypothetical protein